MVKYQDQTLDRVFAALSDSTRRALVVRLEQAESLTVSELAEPFPVSLPAIMKHLDVLSDAGLIERNKQGRSVNCRLTPIAMKSAMDWLHRYERFWSERLCRLKVLLEDDPSWSPQQQRSQASPSSSASRRPPRRSMPPSPTRKR
jgi:DNA-binding transcriptional ArsR family regulator